MNRSKGVSIFTGSCPLNLETQVNDWLTDFSEELYPTDFRLSSCFSTDPKEVQYSIVVVYENLSHDEDESW